MTGQVRQDTQIHAALDQIVEIEMPENVRAGKALDVVLLGDPVN